MCLHSAADGGAAEFGCCVEGLIAQVEASALSENTRKTYETGWNSWVRWADANGVRGSKATAEGIVGWLAALYMEGKKPSTLRTYLAAVAYKLNGLSGANPARHPRVRLLLAGIVRHAAERGVAARQADPLRAEHIEQIIGSAPAPRHNQPGGRLETPEQAKRRADVDIAMVVVAHNGALRCSEMLALRWGDVDFFEGGGLATIWIRRSKSDQKGQGAAVAISEYAAQALARIKPEDARPGDLIFGFSPSTARRRFKAAALAAGIDPAGITTHSPRIGMAQDLAEWGVEMPGLMLAGRWDTAEIAAQYTKGLQARHTPAAQYLKEQLPAKMGWPRAGSESGETRRPPNTATGRRAA